MKTFIIMAALFVLSVNPAFASAGMYNCEQKTRYGQILVNAIDEAGVSPSGFLARPLDMARFSLKEGHFCELHAYSLCYALNKEIALLGPLEADPARGKTAQEKLDIALLEFALTFTDENGLDEFACPLYPQLTQ